MTINTLKLRQKAAILQMTFSWMKIIVFWLTSPWNSLPWEWQWDSICSYYGLMSKRWQAIICTNYDLVYWWIYALPILDELNPMPLDYSDGFTHELMDSASAQELYLLCTNPPMEPTRTNLEPFHDKGVMELCDHNYLRPLVRVHLAIVSCINLKTNYLKNNHWTTCSIIPEG